VLSVKVQAQTAEVQDIKGVQAQTAEVQEDVKGVQAQTAEVQEDNGVKTQTA
jgi:flagellar basal body rod protein FlgF